MDNEERFKLNRLGDNMWELCSNHELEPDGSGRSKTLFVGLMEDIDDLGMFLITEALAWRLKNRTRMGF